MNQLKIIVPVLTFLLLISCSLKKENNTIAPHPDFKIGKKGFENKLKEVFNFEKITFGSGINRNLGVSSTGLNLTFYMNDLDVVSNEKLSKYAKIIKFETNKNLLKLDNYNFVKITFKEEKQEEEFTKSTSIKIKKQLK